MSTWIDTARQIAGDGERARDYGSPLVNFLRIAILWSHWLNYKVTPGDVAWMMVLIKVAREQATHKDNNAIDIIGYLHCLDMMNQEMRERGFSGVSLFDDCSLAVMQTIYEIVKGDKSE